MNNDKELLELAAKAAGVDGVYCKTHDWNDNSWDGIGYQNYHYLSWWNPLRSKSNCLQMEIDLKFAAIEFDDETDTWVVCKKIGKYEYRGIASHKDRQRASTMAAAKIGRSM